MSKRYKWIRRNESANKCLYCCRTGCVEESSRMEGLSAFNLMEVAHNWGIYFPLCRRTAVCSSQGRCPLRDLAHRSGCMESRVCARVGSHRGARSQSDCPGPIVCAATPLRLDLFFFQRVPLAGWLNPFLDSLWLIRSGQLCKCSHGRGCGSGAQFRWIW